jgi:hypothetical protein
MIARFSGGKFSNMATIAGAYSPAGGKSDSKAVLTFIGIVWIGVLSGFGFERGLDYPPIVHVHAVTFVSWLVLFTVQAALIRNDRADLHRRLGMALAVLAAWMLIVGPATAIVVDATRFAKDGRTPEFLAVQFTDLLAFGGLTAAGLLARRNRDAHKRLMLLGLFYLSGAGFARFLNAIAAMPLGDSRLGEFVALYAGPDLLVLALGGYDLVTRGRLSRAYIGGVAYTIAFQLLGSSLLHSEGWRQISLRLIGA